MMVRLRSHVPLLLLLAFAPSTTAWANCRCDDPTALLERARRSHVRGELAHAVLQYERLQCCLIDAEPGRGPSPGVTLFESAAVLADAGRIDQAIESYHRYLARPDIDPARTDLAHAAIEALRHRRPGALAVQCAEPDLRVALVHPEDRGDGLCPTQWDGLAPGTWRLEIQTPDGRRLRREVKIAPGAVRWVEAGTRATLEVVDAPLGATATVDGHPLPITVAPVEVPAGPVTIRVAAPGHLPSTRRIDLPPAQTTTVSIPLLADVPAPPPMGDPFPSAVRWTGLVLGWGLLASSGAALGAANGHYAEASREGRLYVSTLDADIALEARRRARLAVDDGGTARQAGYAMLGVGIGLVVGSAWLFLLDTLAEPELSPSPSTGLHRGESP